MENYKPNSHKFREEQKENGTERKKLEKAVTGAVTVKKKSKLNKFADMFLSEDVHNVKTYLISDVLVPTIKNLIYDGITDSLDMILNGGRGRRGRRSSGGYRADYISYDKYSSRKYDRKYEEPRRTGYGYDDILYETRGDAESVLTLMDEAIDNFGVVSVADLYDISGITSNPYTDNRYGWTNISSAEVVRTRDGRYTIKMPRALPID